MPKPRKNATRTLSNKNIDEYIDGIYSGKYNEDNLPPFVYDSISEYLLDGLYKGFGTDYNQLLKQAEADFGAYGKDLELLEKLRTNSYMFAAAKTYEMTKDISSLLVDEESNTVRTLREFQDAAREKYSDWNDNYGETEYSTALGQGYSAQQWNDIEKRKGVLPNLRYSAIGDACEICEPLDGLVAPVDDPIWDKVAPLNHFNCKCIVLSESEDVDLTEEADKKEVYDNAVEKMSPMFATNPGKTGMVFSEDHPYFEAARADMRGADNFGMDIPHKD